MDKDHLQNITKNHLTVYVVSWPKKCITLDEDEIYDSRLHMNNTYLTIFQTTSKTITYLHR